MSFCLSDVRPIFSGFPLPALAARLFSTFFIYPTAQGQSPSHTSIIPFSKQFPAYGVLATSPLTNFRPIPSKAFWNLPCVQKLTLRKFSLQLSAEWVSKRKQNTFCENYGLERCSCRSRPSELTTALVASPTVGDSIGQNVPIVCRESRVV